MGPGRKPPLPLARLLFVPWLVAGAGSIAGISPLLAILIALLLALLLLDLSYRQRRIPR